jgi:hypothetical protein
VSFAAITLCVASQQVFVVVSIYFIIDSVRKFFDTPLYIWCDSSTVSAYHPRHCYLAHSFQLPEYMDMSQNQSHNIM